MAMSSVLHFHKSILLYIFSQHLANVLALMKSKPF